MWIVGFATGSGPLTQPHDVVPTATFMTPPPDYNSVAAGGDGMADVSAVPEPNPPVPGGPTVLCRVCQASINIEGKMHQHVVKCPHCHEATVCVRWARVHICVCCSQSVPRQPARNTCAVRATACSSARRRRIVLRVRDRTANASSRSAHRRWARPCAHRLAHVVWRVRTVPKCSWCVRVCNTHMLGVAVQYTHQHTGALSALSQSVSGCVCVRALA